MKFYKTLKIPIQGNEEKLDELHNCWIKLLNAVVKYTVSLGSAKQLDIQNALYHPLRNYTKDRWNLHSSHLPVLFKTASEIVRSCLEACKSNCRTRFPKIHEKIPIVLCQNTCKIYKGDSLHARIAYEPNNPIDIKLLPSKEHEQLLEETIEKRNNLRIHGLKLLKREDRWWLYVSLKKDIEIRKWEDCQTAIGVDMGLNHIVVCSAFDGKPHKPLYIHGDVWKQLVKERKEKFSKLQGVGKDLHEVSQYYSRRLDEILHTIAKRTVEYAKNFEKPVIVMEDLDVTVKRQTENKKWNYLLSTWARRKLQNLIEYKANWEGIPIFKVNPYNTSKICHKCGNIGKRENGMFRCSNCNKKYEADYNASVNITKCFFVYKQRRLSRAIVSAQLSGASNTQTTTNFN